MPLSSWVFGNYWCAVHIIGGFLEIIFHKFFAYRPSEKSKGLKEAEEEELLTKGPGSFPLERLIAIFQCLTSVGEDPVDEETDLEDSLGIQSGNNALMSTLLLQLSSLCNANFILKGGSCPLEGSTRYRSMVSEDLALKVIFIQRLSMCIYLILWPSIQFLRVNPVGQCCRWQKALTSLYQSTSTEDNL